MISFKNSFLTVMNALFFVLFASSNANAESFKIKLRWEPVKGAYHYKIQISADIHFRMILDESQTPEPAWVWKWDSEKVILKNSEVFYRVASLSKLGKISRYSEPMSFLLPQVQVAAKSEQVSNATPTPTKTPEAEVKVHESLEKSYFTWLWDTWSYQGLGNMTQKSNASNLQSVSIRSAFFQQKSGISFGLQKNYPSNGHAEKQVVLQAEFQFLTFRGVDQPKIYLQPGVSGFSMQISLLRYWDPNPKFSLGYGLTGDRAFRWVKTGTESVDTEGAFSVGPYLSVDIKFPRARPWAPIDLNMTLIAPFSGKWTGGQITLQGSLFSEWAVWRWPKDFLGVRLGGGATYQMWSRPDQTTLTSWFVGIAPIFHTAWGARK